VLNPILCAKAKQFSRTLYHDCTKGEEKILIYMNSEERHHNRYIRRRAKREAKKNERCRAIGGIEQAMSFHELYKAGKKCCNGVRWKNSVQCFELHLLSGTAVRHKQVISGTWKPAPYVHFLLSERGKIRPIDAPRIQDRQVHKAYTKNVLLPLYRPEMIWNNGASLEGKGFEFSINLLKEELHDHFRKYGREGWIIVADFKQFFPSAPHEQVYMRHEALIRDEMLKNFGDEIVSSVPGGEGMPLGVEPSQAEMVALPSPIDNYMKCQLSIKGFGHYMDDYHILVPPDRNLKEILRLFIEKVNKMGLRISANKTKIIPLTKPFKYCKATYYLTETGAVIVHGSRDGIKRDRKKIKAYPAKIFMNEMTYEDLWTSVNAMMAYFENYNDHTRVLRLRRLFYSLFHFSCEHFENFRKRSISVKYIAHRRFKAKAICGEVNIPALTELESTDGIIYYNGKQLCTITSENAHQFFAYNDDGNGLERGKLTQSIIKQLSTPDSKHQERWDKVWDDEKCQPYRRQESADHWYWNHAFFNADLGTLKHIADLVGARR